MINSIKLLRENSEQDLDIVQINQHQIEIDSEFSDEFSATIHIEFKTPIVQFRNHDYTWISIKKRHYSNWYAPKIIQLKNNQLIQANYHIGIWEVNSKTPNVLLWHFNLDKSCPITTYDSQYSKGIVEAVSKNNVKQKLALLFPVKKALEVSRSKIPFSAIACFTDHCDFDTLANLKLQRQFFKKYNIKITKGFFLNDYSKRPDTASFKKHSEELKIWIDDGHELAYHSLSQSIKSLDESFDDLENLKPPFSNVSSWIDHGFQPYNVSLYQNHVRIRDTYSTILKNKDIDSFWNYVDSGTAVNGVINQLNPEHFTLGSFYNGVRHLKIGKRFPLLIKNAIFYYYNTDSTLRLYRSIAKYSKTRKRKKRFKAHFKFAIKLLKLLRLLSPIVIFWRRKKNEVYPLAKYTPVIFNQDISQNTFTVFQTIEIVDFKSGLNPKNVDSLIKEKGLFIAHTYFSAPMDYHHGRLFDSKNEISVEVEDNFNYLSKKINSNEIWNPTLKELIEHFKKMSAVVFKCNEKGELLISNNNQLEFREV